MELPLVSIGIPTYNRSEGLKRPLNCVVNQTYKNLEIIISDNCSSNAVIQKVILNFAKIEECVNFLEQNPDHVLC